MMKAFTSKAFWRDTAERVVATFTQAFLAAIPVLAAVEAALKGDTTTLQSLTVAAATGGIAASLSFLKAVIASLVPGTVSEASFAKEPDATATGQDDQATGTFNGERPDDGPQDVSQDPDVIIESDVVDGEQG